MIEARIHEGAGRPVSPSLQRAVESWNTLWETLPLGAYVCDAEGRILRFNRRAAELWGREPRIADATDAWSGASREYDLEGRPIPPADTATAYALRSGNRVDGQEVVVERPDGVRLVVMLHVDPLKHDDGAVVGAICCFHDVTARRRAQEQLAGREHWYRQLLDGLPAAIYTTDAGGRVTYCNEAAAKLAGRTPVLGKDEWCVTWQLRTEDGRALPHEECPMAVALKEGRPVRGAKIVALRPDGTSATVVPYPTPLRDPAGRLVGAVNMLVDISQQEAMDRRFRENETILRAMFDTTPECIKIVARDGTLLRMNQAGLDIVEAPLADLVVGRGAFDLIAPEHRDLWRLYHDRVCGGESLTWEFDFIGLRGTRRSMETHATPLTMPDGSTAQLAVTRDVSARKRAEAQRRLLLNELNHRFKNSLATIQSLVMQTIGNAGTVEEARALVEERLVALARAHDLLTHEHWEGANLVDVVEGSLAIHCARPGRFAVQGPPLRLKPKAALGLSMVVHELCTNATKYGALSNETGRIAVTWDCEGGGAAGRLRLCWEESGGPPVAEPLHRGFGSRLIERAVSMDLRGEAQIDYRRCGVVCRMAMPLAAVAAAR